MFTDMKINNSDYRVITLSNPVGQNHVLKADIRSLDHTISLLYSNKLFITVCTLFRRVNVS
jgi:hypothetical protein